MNDTVIRLLVNEEEPVYRTHKDRVFTLLFRDREKLLELYNALNDTAYSREDDLTVNTLENAIFIKMKNDVSFVINSEDPDSHPAFYRVLQRNRPKGRSV